MEINGLVGTGVLEPREGNWGLPVASPEAFRGPFLAEQGEIRLSETLLVGVRRTPGMNLAVGLV